MNNPVDILIPTFNNQQLLAQCLYSLLRNRSSENIYRIFVINNGHPKSCDWIDNAHVTVVQSGGENLGWEGGLKLGLTHSTAPFVCFLNDDTHIPDASRNWMHKLLDSFRDPSVGAVGPSSNVVMGYQNIFARPTAHILSTRLLIGFCMLLRRSALDTAGGVDDSLPGGDDFDLSIRLRNASYKLIIDREVFVYHHGFKTGERVYGTSDKAGGWNSYEFKEKTDLALIKKHGFKKWWDVTKAAWEEPTAISREWRDSEAEYIRERIRGKRVLDLGCGGSKTTKTAIGVDMIPKGEYIGTLDTRSVADVVANIDEPLPFPPNSVDTIIARHILEHMLDPLTVLRQWKEVLKPGGRILIAVPDEDLIRSIPMNIEHLHAWNPASMKVTLEAAGYHVTEQCSGDNGVSFISVAVKEGE